MASANRGCKAITQGGGCRAALLKDGITRAPCLRMPDAMAAAALKRWADDPQNFESIKAAFETTTSFGEPALFFAGRCRSWCLRRGGVRRILSRGSLGSDTECHTFSRQRLRYTRKYLPSATQRSDPSDPTLDQYDPRDLFQQASYRASPPRWPAATCTSDSTASPGTPWV